MGKIDDHVEILSFINLLQTSLHLRNGFARRNDLIQIDSCFMQGGNDSEQIVNIVCSNQIGHDRIRLPVMDQIEMRSLVCHLDMDRAVIRLVLDPVCDDAGCTQRHELLVFWIVAIEDAYALRLYAVFEQDRLGIKIVFERAMKVEMIVCEIRKDGYIEIDPVHPSLRQAVRADFECARLHTGIDHVIQPGLQEQSVRRGQIRHELDVSVFDRDRADIACRFERIKDRADHIGDRAFSVRSCNSVHGHFIGRLAEEDPGALIHRFVDIGYPDIDHAVALIGDRPGMNDTDRPVFDRGIDKIMPIVC